MRCGYQQRDTIAARLVRSAYAVLLAVAACACIQAATPGMAHASGSDPGSAPAPSLAATLAAQQTTDDTYVVYDLQWALESVGAYDAWDHVRANHAVTVAVIDDGFNVNHEDLKNNIVAPYNSTSVGDDTDVSGGQGHGTAVAGIIAGEANNGKGIAGVSYNANVMPVKAATATASSYTFTSADIVRAYDHILENASKYNVRVVNLSLGEYRSSGVLTNSDAAIQAAINKAHRQGIVTVTAACNKLRDTTADFPYHCSPGDLDNVVTVIGLARSGAGVVRADTSNYNLVGQKTKDIAAPGTEAVSSYVPYDYSYSYMEKFGIYVGTLDGTSYAAPCVAGVLALMFTANPGLTPDAAASKLYASADDIAYSNRNETAGAGWDRYTGYGQVNAVAAVADYAPKLNGAATLAVGKTTTLTPSKSDAWTWKTSNGSVATVNSSGVVTGRKAGTATISIANKAGTLFASRNVTVCSPAISGTSSVGFGATARLSVSGGPAGSWIWSSSNGSVAAVNSSGVVAGKNAGTATITARLASNAAITASKTIAVSRVSIASAAVKVAGATYTGAAHRPAPSVTVGGRALLSGSDYKVAYANNVNAGTAKAIITAGGNYAGTRTVTFAIAKATQPLVAKAAYSKKALRFKTLKKKAQKLAKCATVKGAKGAVTFKKTSGNAKIAVAAKTGKVTVKKRLARGTYTVKVKVSAKATANYKAASKTVKFKVVVK